VRPDGKLALVVGDVVGHGVTAAAAMSQLRAILHERLSAGVGLVEALTAVDAVALRSPSTRAATVCAAIVDTEDGHVEYCTAGHPPPLVVDPDGTTRYLEITGSGPLGTGSGFAVGTTHLDKTNLVLLYTDGILQRPGRALVEATVELATVVADAAAGRGFLDTSGTTTQRVCALTSELLLRATGQADDVTLLVAQRRSQPADLAVTFEARATSLREMRMALSHWMTGAGIENDAMAVQHAVGELAANVVEHAYRDAAGLGEFTLTATVTDHGETIIAVIDHGRWRPPATSSDGSHGRGLSMANQLVDAVDVEHTDAGTTATVRHRLRQPAALTRLAGRPAPTGSERGPAESVQPLLILEPPDHDRILVDGPLDMNTAGELRFELNQRTRGGTASLAVDLTGVTHLASAAVAVLHDAVAASARHDQTLRLFAAPGTVAQHILSVAGLSHSSTDEGSDESTMTRANEPPGEGP
jgi:anti-sigma regulatory factor (Ser/Thr protein kinase)/anti-anti-sigma regulatory factor